MWWWGSFHLTVSHKSSSCREMPDTRPSPHCSSVSNPTILHQLSVTKLHTSPRTQLWNGSHPRKYHQIMVHESRSSSRSSLQSVWEQILTIGGNVNLYSWKNGVQWKHANKKNTLCQVANYLITLKGLVHVTRDWSSLWHLLHIPEQIFFDPVYTHSIASVSRCNMLDSKLLLFFSVFGTQQITQQVQGIQKPMHKEIWKVSYPSWPVSGRPCFVSADLLDSTLYFLNTEQLELLSLLVVAILHYLKETLKLAMKQEAWRIPDKFSVW